MSHLCRVISKKLPALKQNATLSIRSRVPQTKLRVIPQWRDGGEISVDKNDVDLKITQDKDKATSLGRSEAHIMVEVNPLKSSAVGNGISIEALVPEKVNLFCHIEDSGNLTIENKVEGDAELINNYGDIMVKKLRSYVMSVEAKDGQIYASDLLEARRVDLRANRIRAKRIHGTDVNIETTTPASGDELKSINFFDDDDDGAAVDISSLYVSGNGVANLTVKSLNFGNNVTTKSIRCKSHHGHVNAEADALVEFGGVNGSFDVVSETEAHIHVDSLAQNSISVVTANKIVSLTMDRKLESDLRLVSTDNNVHNLARSTLLEEEDDLVFKGLKEIGLSKRRRGRPISVITTCFKRDKIPSFLDDLHYLQGHLSNESLEPDSRFEQQNVLGGGKIRLDGAATQALSGFFSEDREDTSHPLVVGGCGDRIIVESMSWLGAIARRYGLKEEEGRSKLGRQATKRGRDLDKDI